MNTTHTTVPALLAIQGYILPCPCISESRFLRTGRKSIRIHFCHGKPLYLDGITAIFPIFCRRRKGGKTGHNSVHSSTEPTSASGAARILHSAVPERRIQAAEEVLVIGQTLHRASHLLSTARPSLLMATSLLKFVPVDL